MWKRLANLWKGFLSLWISDIEKEHPEIALRPDEGVVVRLEKRDA